MRTTACVLFACALLAALPTVRTAPEDVAFPNVDLTAHLFAAPADGWLGLDTTVSFGAGGVGLTTSVVHDERGPIGTSSQCLTVRPTAGDVPSPT